MNVVHPAEQIGVWEKVQIARHAQRPHAEDFIRRLCSSFVELRGDRQFADDQAMIGGLGSSAGGPLVVLAHRKGRTMRENLRCNFGMPHPEGYRKAHRLMLHAERFGMPLVCLIDTPGAHPGIQAEERGQAQAIAQNLLTMAGLQVPIVAVVTGEGSSGGALAIGLADRLLMLEHAIYTVASPEASASILWHDARQAPEAAAMMKITALDIFDLGIADAIVPEPPGGAHLNPAVAVETTVTAILETLEHLRAIPQERLLRERYERYRAIGAFEEPEQIALPSWLTIDELRCAS